MSDLNLPKGMKQIDELCPKCSMKLYEINGKKFCGECPTIDSKEELLKRIDDNAVKNQDAIENYHREKNGTLKKDIPVEDGKSKAYRD